MNYLSLKKYNLYSTRFGSLLYFDVKTAEYLPVISGKNPCGIKGLPTGKSYIATQSKYVFIRFCSAIKIFSDFVCNNVCIYNYIIFRTKKYQATYQQPEDIWKQANKSSLPKSKK